MKWGRGAQQKEKNTKRGAAEAPWKNLLIRGFSNPLHISILMFTESGGGVQRKHNEMRLRCRFISFSRLFLFFFSSSFLVISVV